MKFVILVFVGLIVFYVGIKLFRFLFRKKKKPTHHYDMPIMTFDLPNIPMPLPRGQLFYFEPTVRYKEPIVPTKTLRKHKFIKTLIRW